jgi:hypothetical protein
MDAGSASALTSSRPVSPSLEVSAAWTRPRSDGWQASRVIPLAGTKMSAFTLTLTMQPTRRHTATAVRPARIARSRRSGRSRRRRPVRPAYCLAVARTGPRRAVSARAQHSGPGGSAVTAAVPRAVPRACRRRAAGRPVHIRARGPVRARDEATPPDPSRPPPTGRRLGLSGHRPSVPGAAGGGSSDAVRRRPRTLQDE